MSLVSPFVDVKALNHGTLFLYSRTDVKVI